MIQRIVRQISECGLNFPITISARENQVETIVNQIGEKVNIVAEQTSRDTFSAIALSATYLLESKKRVGKKSFAELRDNYASLPKNSFDYEVVERVKSLAVVEFFGQWEDLGTWDSLSNRIERKIENAYVDDSSTNTTVVNKSRIPIVALGVKKTIIVASEDGILVADKSKSSDLKSYMKKMGVML